MGNSIPIALVSRMLLSLKAVSQRVPQSSQPQGTGRLVSSTRVRPRAEMVN